jgi:hypothetical protein
MKARKVGTVLFAFGAALAVLTLWAQSAAGLDPRARACGAESWPVLGTFEVARVDEVGQHLPHMKPAPELNGSIPAYVVLFDGPIELPRPRFVHGEAHAETGVICVFVNGVPGFYTDVDIRGWSK